MKRSIRQLCTVLLLAVAVLSAGVMAQKAETVAAWKADAATLPARIWGDPGEMASLDLTYGAGGRTHAPDPAGTFTFVKEDLGGSNPKFEVTDAQGVSWKVKLGDEAKPETAATRFLWAAGYLVDEDYFVPTLTVDGLSTLKRGGKLVSPGGIIHGARLERKPANVRKLEDWDWFDNPFVGQRELNGLCVMMALLNNWDLKQVNNTVYVDGGERRYVVSDMGATFGHTGNALQRSRSKPKDYAGSKFVKKAHGEFIDFEMHSRPLFLFYVATSNYRQRTRMEKLTRNIPRADAKWLGQRLAKLSDGQIQDAFRGAGYGTADVETLTRTVRQRITALEVL